MKLMEEKAAMRKRLGLRPWCLRWSQIVRWLIGKARWYRFLSLRNAFSRIISTKRSCRARILTIGRIVSDEAKGKHMEQLFTHRKTLSMLIRQVLSSVANPLVLTPTSTWQIRWSPVQLHTSLPIACTGSPPHKSAPKPFEWRKTGTIRTPLGSAPTDISQSSAYTVHQMCSIRSRVLIR